VLHSKLAAPSNDGISVVRGQSVNLTVIFNLC